MERAVRALLAIALVVVPTCGVADDDIGHRTEAGEILLEVTTFGGLPPPSHVLESTLPDFVLYGDGTVMVGVDDGVLPAMSIGKMNDEGIQRVLAAANDAGLMEGSRELKVDDDLFDATTTLIVVAAEGETHRTSVYGLGYGAPANDEVSGIEAFVEKLHDLPRLVGNGAVIDDLDPYGSPAIAIAATRVPSGPSTPVADWNFHGLSTLDGQMEVNRTRWRCGVLGSRAVDIAATLEAAPPEAIWVSDGDTYKLFGRPILPHELELTGCEPWRSEAASAPS